MPSGVPVCALDKDTTDYQSINFNNNLTLKRPFKDCVNIRSHVDAGVFCIRYRRPARVSSTALFIASKRRSRSFFWCFRRIAAFILLCIPGIRLSLKSDLIRFGQRPDTCSGLLRQSHSSVAYIGPS